MKIQLRILFAILVITFLLILTAPSEAAQGGVLVKETVNTRMDTYTIHRSVYKRFTYELDAEGTDTWQVYDGNFPFVGDCEDFAFTMQHRIGSGSVYPAYLPTGAETPKEDIKPNHAVFIYAGIVWELNGRAINVQRYESNGRRIFFRNGDITPELR